ncbi:TetR/AcrR family transcriptional regulator [Nocardiopsis lambiniae]|uniref:Helix-turn-helix domain-containing protein n=1 Tax=Nocardiopsis lambiniae TaxID=3075539 RepID=A0ABU2M6Y6_9ACTN|nr:helix-turn-helix domain-containing protein [Nocardiopsis sp. DSM 44743]MDT0328429.1 helix-turn-helix domain-containing protein [Nocardiopsis sp. DSM 44743]
MPSSRTRHNRGPAAASDNRAAVLAAARSLFADQGYQVPLNAIARAAGVGQGVLYRHFPTRLDLAFAVFEENFAELEALAADSGPEGFGRLWRRLVEMTVAEAAFVEMVVDARRALPDYDGPRRLAALLEEPLRRAREAGSAPATADPRDVLTAVRMVYGVTVTEPDRDHTRAAVERALGLLPRWFPPIPEGG